jgi:hypothetical protein
MSDEMADIKEPLLIKQESNTAELIGQVMCGLCYNFATLPREP